MASQRFALFACALGLAACSDKVPPNNADASTIYIDTPSDLSSDVARDGSVDVAPDLPPYDAGAAPSCNVAAFTRHVLDQASGVNLLELGGLVRLGDSFTLAVRQAAPRTTSPDAGTPRRDTIDVMSVSDLGFPTVDRWTAYDSAASQSDLGTPTLVRSGDLALLLFRESVGLQGAGSVFSTRVRTSLLTGAASVQSARASLEDRADPFAATLPDGSTLVLSSRIVARDDAGVIAAAPNTVHILANGMPATTMGVDIQSVVPIEADSVLMLPAPDGAVLAFRRGTELRAVRFDRTGLIDTRVRVTRDVDAVRIDDGAAFDEGNVLAWDDAQGERHAIHVAVTDTEGALLTHQVIERYEAPGSPVVNVSRAYGGAAILWIRSSGDSAVLRGAVMQPNGVLRAPPRDLLPVPGADGRLFAVGEGRSLSFVARDRTASGYGVTFGRLCLPDR